MKERRVVIPTDALMSEVAERLASGQKVTLPVKGDSMLPFIVGDADRVVVERRSLVKKGDIVLAKTIGSTYVIHRVMGISQEYVTLMGDGNLVGREQCRRADVLGVITSIIHNGKPINPNSYLQRVYSKTWCSLLAIRRYLLWVFRKINGYK